MDPSRLRLMSKTLTATIAEISTMLFYEQMLRVKDIAYLSFADHVQRLLVICIRKDLEQLRAYEWFEGRSGWTGDYGRYCLAHAGYAWSNNNKGTEVDWRDMKGVCPPSTAISTFTGATHEHGPLMFMTST